MLPAISDAMTARATVAAEARGRARGSGTPARIHAHRKAGVVVWYLDDGALALYRLAGGGVREPEAHFDGLPATEGLMRVLNGRYYVVEERDAGLASRD
jgi:hypothetical protein